MRILCTGSEGFIGKHLVTALKKDERNQVFGVDLLNGHDVCDLPSTIHYDQIYHLASPVGPVGILNQSGYLAHDIIRALHHVLNVARWGNCTRVLYVSSSEVYGPRPFSDPIQLSENMACICPTFVTTRLEYGMAKLCGEIMATNYAKARGIDLRIVRLFNTIGENQESCKGFVVPRFMEQAKTGKNLTVYGDGEQIRSFIDVRDVVAGMRCVMTQGTPYEVYNIGNPENVMTILALAKQIISIVGGRSKVEHVNPVDLHGDRFAEAWNKIPCIDKIKKLGWSPSISLNETLERLYATP